MISDFNESIYSSLTSSIDDLSFSPIISSTNIPPLTSTILTLTPTKSALAPTIPSLTPSILFSSLITSPSVFSSSVNDLYSSPTTDHTSVAITLPVAIGSAALLLILILFCISCCLCFICRRQSRKKKSYNLRVKSLLEEETYLKKPSYKITSKTAFDPGLEISTFTKFNVSSDTPPPIQDKDDDQNNTDREQNQHQMNDSPTKNKNEEAPDDCILMDSKSNITGSVGSDINPHNQETLDESVNQILQALAEN